MQDLASDRQQTHSFFAVMLQCSAQLSTLNKLLDATKWVTGADFARKLCREPMYEEIMTLEDFHGLEAYRARLWSHQLRCLQAHAPCALAPHPCPPFLQSHICVHKQSPLCILCPDWSQAHSHVQFLNRQDLWGNEDVIA